MYTTKAQEKSFIVSDSKGKPLYFMIHDELTSASVPSNGQKLLAEYLRDALVIFRSEMEILMETSRVFTEKDEERLMIMFKLLLDARKTWQEENTQGAKECC